MNFSIFDAVIESGKKYEIIYADPPWHYKDKALAGNRGASCKYSTMTIGELEQLPVNEIASKDSVLFMWGTWPQIESVLKLISSWGFNFKTVGFVWIKKTKKNKPVIGMGNYTRSNSEYCLIATKGKGCQRFNKGISQIIESPRRKHSQKPDEVRNRIAELYGNQSRIELFARENVFGWDAWGNDPSLKQKSFEKPELFLVTNTKEKGLL